MSEQTRSQIRRGSEIPPTTFFMNFRLIWVGSDDQDGDSRDDRASAAALLGGSSLQYEQHGTEMVRRERSETGKVRFIRAANFTARIISDVVVESSPGQERDFVLEAQLAAQRNTFQISAAEFARMSWGTPGS